MNNFCLAALAVALVASVCHASDRVPSESIPLEVKPFIERGADLLRLEQADLNGDGGRDYLVVLQKIPDENGEAARSLLILARDPQGGLKQVKRNDEIILCASCGGLKGDPLEDLSVGTKTFTVSHYGGSRWRWRNSYRFDYSRRDRSWQLVRAEESEFDSTDPEGTMRTISRVPPKHYGKIDIADFDPERYVGIGPK